MEIWRDIEGYEGLYQISNLGRVKSLNYKRTGKEKILKYKIENNGYIWKHAKDYEKIPFKVFDLTIYKKIN